MICSSGLNSHLWSSCLLTICAEFCTTKQRARFLRNLMVHSYLTKHQKMGSGYIVFIVAIAKRMMHLDADNLQNALCLAKQHQCNFALSFERF